ncbi:MAG: AP2/ERF family transcription factor [Chloroherpetonaceae bacterium]|nr:AP2/ERF family transcription factor [Chloroherpetonaceae bacterium]
MPKKNKNKREKKSSVNRPKKLGKLAKLKLKNDKTPDPRQVHIKPNEPKDTVPKEAQSKAAKRKPSQDKGISSNLDHISRIDSGATHAWFVRMRRNGKVFSKTFSDRKLGGKDASLQKAIQFRDEMLGQLDHIAGIQIPRFRFLKENKRNKSGYTGVLKLSRTQYGILREDYVAQWHEERYKLRRKYFSIAKFGEEEAFRLAKEYREKMMKKLAKRTKKEMKKLKKTLKHKSEP